MDMKLVTKNTEKCPTTLTLKEMEEYSWKRDQYENHWIRIERSLTEMFKHV